LRCRIRRSPQHFGSAEYSVPFARFRDALRVEYRGNSAVSRLLSDKNMQFLRIKLISGGSAVDSGGRASAASGDGTVTAYAFAGMCCLLL
jgi:hypothetical protein